MLASLTILNVDDPAIFTRREGVPWRTLGEDSLRTFGSGRVAGGRFALTETRAGLGPYGIFEDDRKAVRHRTRYRDSARRKTTSSRSASWASTCGGYSKRGLLIGAGWPERWWVPSRCSAATRAANPITATLAAWPLFFAIGGGGIGLELGTIIGAIAPRTPDASPRPAGFFEELTVVFVSTSPTTWAPPSTSELGAKSLPGR